MKQIREQVGADLDEYVDVREEKLPVWAQQLLTKQRRALAEERIANAALRGEVGDDSDTCVQNYKVPDQPLPRGARIGFIPAPGEEITCRLRDGVLQVDVHGGTLSITPQAQNAIHVTVRER